MSKENQARLLDILCQSCGNNKIKGSERIDCKNKSEDLCVAAVEHLDKNNVFSIKAIEFPSWKKFDGGCFSVYGYNYMPIITIELIERLNAIQVNINEIKVSFEYGEQGYKQACEWIENKRIKLIKKLCEG